MVTKKQRERQDLGKELYKSRDVDIKEYKHHTIITITFVPDYYHDKIYKFNNKDYIFNKDTVDYILCKLYIDYPFAILNDLYIDIRDENELYMEVEFIDKSPKCVITMTEGY